MYSLMGKNRYATIVATIWSTNQPHVLLLENEARLTGKMNSLQEPQSTRIFFAFAVPIVRGTRNMQ